MQTRKPTGEAGWPNLLIEGTEGAGKTYNSLTFSGDPRIGSCWVIEVGEHRADEYAALGDFEIVEHDGTLRGIVEAVREVMAQVPTDGRPNVLVLDSMTAMWDLCKRKAEEVARSSKAATELLAKDPDAEITIGHQAWNRVKDPWWWSWVNELRGWPGIFLGTARADEVAKFVNGKPVANQTEYRVDIEKGTPFALDGTVRMRVGQPPVLTTVKSLRCQVPNSGLDLPAEHPLAHLVFDLLGAGTEVKLNVAQAKAALMSHARSLGHDEASAKSAATHAWNKVSNGRAAFDAATMRELSNELPDPMPEDEPAQGELVPA